MLFIPISRQNHEEKSELAFQTWKKEKELALQKKFEDKKKEKENREAEEKERKRIEAEKVMNDFCLGFILGNTYPPGRHLVFIPKIFRAFFTLIYFIPGGYVM